MRRPIEHSNELHQTYAALLGGMGGIEIEVADWAESYIGPWVVVQPLRPHRLDDKSGVVTVDDGVLTRLLRAGNWPDRGE
jgi:hypothetical protein